jgi:hypothetical protein
MPCPSFHTEQLPIRRENLQVFGTYKFGEVPKRSRGMLYWRRAWGSVLDDVKPNWTIYTHRASLLIAMTLLEMQDQVYNKNSFEEDT